jgi:hypothetical protein
MKLHFSPGVCSPFRGTSSSTRSARRVLLAVAVVGVSCRSYAQPQNQAPLPAAPRAEETLATWNDIGKKLVAMAQDFPEEKYDFKVEKDQRTFAQNILHVAGVDYVLMRTTSDSSIGPDLGKDMKDIEDPSRNVYKTKADVVNLIQRAVADGAKLIQRQGDAGLDKITKFPWGNKLVHNSYTWERAIEHSGEHFGQLVVYYRANNLVPPESRPRSGNEQPTGPQPR